MTKKKTHEEFVTEVYNLVGNDYKVLSKYINNNKYVLMKHNKCQHEWDISPNNFLRGRRCPNCAGSIQYTYEQVKQFIESLGYELISKEYKNNKQKLIFKDKDGYYYMITFDNIKKGCIPDKFIKSNPYTIQNIKLWCKLNNKEFKLLSDTYEGADKYLQWKCLKEECGEIFEANWGNIQTGYNCGVCDGRQVRLSNCLATRNPELATEWHPSKNGNLTPYNFTCGSGEYAWWLCKECNHEWYVRIADRNNGKGCPECNKSKGEKEINRVLTNNNWIKIFQEEFNLLTKQDKYNNYFIPQYTFDNLIGLGGGLLLFDYYMPILNLLIEYDGEYHYKPIKKYKNEPIKYAEERLKKQKMHDKLKDNYTKNNNIKLLRIPYWDFDKIEEILERELNSLNIINIAI